MTVERRRAAVTDVIATVGQSARWACRGTSGMDSQLEFTFYSGDTVLGSFVVDLPIDEAFFVGVVLDQTTNGLEIREVGSTNDLGDQCNENDFFGKIYTKGE